MSVIALIPARSGSKGCAGKNLRTLGGKPLIQLAVECAQAAGCDWIEVSTDYTYEELYAAGVRAPVVSHRPPELCSDTAAMIDVVRHVWNGIPADSPIDLMVLLQPTAVFRKPEHVTEAIRLLKKRGTDSVVSVVELPRTHCPEYALNISRGVVKMALNDSALGSGLPSRRQDVDPAYIRDGTVYAFWRRTVESYADIYGERTRPLVIDPADSCELDTLEDWAALERRWQERHG